MILIMPKLTPTKPLIATLIMRVLYISFRILSMIILSFFRFFNMVLDIGFEPTMLYTALQRRCFRPLSQSSLNKKCQVSRLASLTTFACDAFCRFIADGVVEKQGIKPWTSHCKCDVLSLALFPHLFWYLTRELNST